MKEQIEKRISELEDLNTNFSTHWLEYNCNIRVINELKRLL